MPISMGFAVAFTGNRAGNGEIVLISSGADKNQSTSGPSS